MAFLRLALFASDLRPNWKKRVRELRAMSEKKPMPLVISRQRPICPVCGHSTYSANGVHPQCAGVQADKLRMLGVRGQPRLVAARRHGAVQTKMCPECHKKTVATTTSCDCGFQFSGVN